MKSRRIVKKRQNRRLVLSPRLLRVIVLILLILLGLYFFSQLNFFKIKEVKVTGNSLVNTQEIKRRSGLNRGDNFWMLDLSDASSKIKLNPLVLEADVSRVFPDKITINVKERRAVAVVPYSRGFIEVDAVGVCLKKSGSLTDLGLPVITGALMDGTPKSGEKVVSSNLFPALKVIGNIDNYAHFHLVEVNVSDPSDILLYTDDGVKIRLGEPLRVEKKLEKLSQIKKSLEEQGAWEELSYIDVSFEGNPVVK